MFVCLLTLLSLVPLFAREPVSRVQTPMAVPPTGDEAPAAEFLPIPLDMGLLKADLRRLALEYPATYGIVIFDPSSGKTVSLNADRSFAAASFGKLPTLIALYKAADRGELSLDDEISMLASDVQAYGTGVLYTYPVGYTMTLRECAYHLMKESDNTAWKMLTRYLGKANVQAELYRIGANSTAYWVPNTTTSSDTLLMLRKIADPSYTSPELSAEMLDLMTNTDFEDRLPQPLPEGSRVAHKIASIDYTFGDAGVVFPQGSEEGAYFIVVIVDGVTEDTARSAIQDISLTTYRFLTNYPPKP